MNEPSPGSHETAQQKSLPDRIHEHTVWGTLLRVVLPVVGIILTATGVTIAYLHGGHDTTPSPGVDATKSASVSAGSSGSSSRSDGVAVDFRLGSCLDSSETPVSCSAVHASQIVGVASATCDESILVTFMGGEAGTDTLLSVRRPQVMSLAGAPQLCVVAVGSDDSTRSVQDLLQDPAGDAWRQCYDDRFTRKEVACDQPHTSETTFKGPIATDETLDCSTRSEAYLGGPMGRYIDDVSVDSSVSGSDAVCSVTVRGNNLLTGSLRRIGTGALPLSPE